MELSRLVEAWTALRKTRSRTAKTAVLAEVLDEASPQEVGLVVEYLAGRLAQGKIGVGYATVRKVAAEVSGAGSGSMALLDVDATFDAIAGQAGKGSTLARHSLLLDLLGRVSKPEREFLVRLIVGELRQGASEGLICEAVALASDVDAAEVRRALMVSGQLAAVASVALREGAVGLGTFQVEVFVPLRPMLAQPSVDIERALESLGSALFEYKLDGARIQVHKQGDEVRVYSRALNEVTGSVPEVVEAALGLDRTSLILDGEAIAIQESGRPHPFQTTMRRFGRRRNVDELRSTLPLSAYFFDLLYLDGETLVDRPLEERLGMMETVVPEQHRPLRQVTSDPEVAEALWSRAIEEGHEGLMAKALDSTYEAGSRGAQWLKLKPAHTLDLVVVAAEWGSGRRKGWLSNLHLAAYDRDGESFVMLGKTFKGLTDELLEWQTRELLAREVSRTDHVVHVKPELVVEIAFNDVQQSPRYPGGLALRFARVVRYRPDKQATSADTFETVRTIHVDATS